MTTPIGNSLLALSLPRNSVEQWERRGRMALLAAPPNISNRDFFLHLAKRQMVWHGPHIAGQGIVLTDVQAGWFENPARA